MTFCNSYLEAVQGADAAVIVTEWPELVGLLSPEVRYAMSNPLIVDGRNLLDPGAARAAGFAYEGVGPAVCVERGRGGDSRAGRRPAVIRDAIVLAGGKAERLGEAAEGRPKSLVRVGEGRCSRTRSLCSCARAWSVWS